MKAMTEEQVKTAAETLVKGLSAENVAYAVDEERGEYRGFAALHDLCDANMLLLDVLPSGYEDDDDVEDYCRQLSRIMDAVNKILL